MNMNLYKWGVMQVPAGGGATYNRIPLNMEQAIPAGFPLPIHSDMFDNITHNNAIFSNIQSGGEDLRAFTDEAMTSEIPVEVVSVNTGSNVLVAFCRVPSALSINDKIYLRTTIGGGESLPAVGSTFGRNNVWQDYLMVSHDMITDSSGNQTISNTGGAALSGASLNNLFPARGFGSTEGSGTTDRSEVDYTGNPTIITVSCMFYEIGNGGGNLGRIVNQEGAGNTLLFTDGANTRHAMFRSYDDPGTAVWRIAQPTTSTWGHAMISHDAGAPTNDPNWRINGVAQSFVEDTNRNGALSTGTVTAWNIGNRNAGDRNWDGRLSCMRWRGDNRDNTWAALEYDGYFDPAAVATAEALATV